MNMMNAQPRVSQDHDLPHAPLAMPKQVLEHDAGPVARLLQALAALLPTARAGH